MQHCWCICYCKTMRERESVQVEEPRSANASLCLLVKTFAVIRSNATLKDGKFLLEMQTRHSIAASVLCLRDKMVLSPHVRDELMDLLKEQLGSRFSVPYPAVIKSMEKQI